MPTTSTRDRLDVHAAAGDREARLQIVRRRISEGFYNRSDVRRTVASLLLRALARRPRRPGSAHPETA